MRGQLDPVLPGHLDHVLVATLVRGLMKQREAAHHMGGGKHSWVARAHEHEAARDAPARLSRLRMSVSELHLEEPEAAVLSLRRPGPPRDSGGKPRL